MLDGVTFRLGRGQFVALAGPMMNLFLALIGGFVGALAFGVVAGAAMWSHRTGKDR